MNRIVFQRRWLAVGPKRTGVGAAVLMALASSALSQGVAPPAQTANGAVQGGGTSEASLDEIVITALRRDERLKDVPAAVSAFTGAQLEKLNITETNQLTNITPGLNFTQSAYSPQPTIRGIGTRGVNSGEESEVPIYVDGVYQSFLPGAIMELNNIERIEVLKGPQGALLGRNAMGGAINIITKTPTQTSNGDFSLSYGSYNQVIAKGYVSGGLGGSDAIAGDLAVMVDHDDGYIRDVATGAELGGQRDVDVRSKVLVHASSSIDLTLSANHSENKHSLGEATAPLDGNTIGASIPGNIIATAPYTTALSFVPYDNATQTGVSGTGVFHFDKFDLTAITSYQQNAIDILTDGDQTPASILSYLNRQLSDNEYNELYATSKLSGPISWMAGVVYYHDLSKNPYISVYFGPAIYKPFTLETVDHVSTNSVAGYAQTTYKFTDQWSATIGGRYTSEYKSFGNNSGTVGVPASFLSLSNHATFNKFTPSATLQYEPFNSLNIYAKAGQGFKSGVFNTSAASVVQAQPVQPETLTQYEVGVKADLSRKVSVSLATYYSDYKNIQTSARNLQGTSYLQNAAAATIYGFEAEAFIRPIERLNLNIGIAGLHGYYNNFPNAAVYFPNTTIHAAAPCESGSGALVGGNGAQTCNVTGKAIYRTPDITANVGGDYTFAVRGSELVLSANVHYQGRSYWDTANVFKENPYTTVDSRLAWRSSNKKYMVALWGENLTDVRYGVSSTPGAVDTTIIYARPRTVGVQVGTSW